MSGHQGSWSTGVDNVIEMPEHLVEDCAPPIVPFIGAFTEGLVTAPKTRRPGIKSLASAALDKNGLNYELNECV
jgi:hypothetical protein